jgi:uncharacterized Fe-S center protein
MEPKVYFTKSITPEGLSQVYRALGVALPGKIGIKVSTGEDGAKGYLKADLIGPFVKSLGGTIIECNTAYPGARNNGKDHIEVAKKHGFTPLPMSTLWTPRAKLRYQFVKANISNTTS